MIRIENYCKPDGVKLIGIPHAFEEDIEGELKPCPLCKRMPKPMVRIDSLDGYFAAVSCFGGRGATHAYVSSKGHSGHMKILNRAITAWNNRDIEVYDEKGKRHKYGLSPDEQ